MKTIERKNFEQLIKQNYYELIPAIMKKELLTVALLMGTWVASAQVGVGTLNPNKSAQLDVVASDKGILIPRVSLKSETDSTTITNGNVESLLVYNEANANGVTPGYYYWYDQKWVRIINSEDILALDTNTTNVSFTVANDELILTDSDGNDVSIPLLEINIPTTIVKNTDGTYTYTNEEGTTIIIDATDNVINNFSTIVNNTQVLNELIEVLGDTYVGGNVYYDGETFTYIDENGDSYVIDFEVLVQQKQKTTTVVDGINTTVTSNVVANNTEYKVNVATANATTLGLVKQAATNPTVFINSDGELSTTASAGNNIIEVTSDYPIAEEDVVVLGNATNDITITLPTAVGKKGRKLTIKKSDAENTTYVNVVSAGGSIDGETDLYTSLPYSGWDLMSDGINWRIVNKF